MTSFYTDNLFPRPRHPRGAGAFISKIAINRLMEMV